MANRKYVITEKYKEEVKCYIGFTLDGVVTSYNISSELYDTLNVGDDVPSDIIDDCIAMERR